MLIESFILAAGSSERTGKVNKLLKKYKGKPLIEHTIQNYLVSKVSRNNIITGYEKEKIVRIANKYNILTHHNRDYKKGLLSSIKIAIKNLGIEKKKLKILNQTHSNKTYYIDNDNLNNNLYGDGLITQDKKISLGVLTADCAPIFLFDKRKSIICCLHAGWKGALNNIVKEGIKKIKKKKIKAKDIVVVIGPCLSINNFEVDKKFKLKFIKKSRFYSNFFKSKNSMKDLFNLRSLINYQLSVEGITNIYNINKDTYKNNDIFFSHRRAIHKNDARTGRMINIISFKD